MKKYMSLLIVGVIASGVATVAAGGGAPPHQVPELGQSGLMLLTALAALGGIRAFMGRKP